MNKYEGNYMIFKLLKKACILSGIVFHTLSDGKMAKYTPLPQCQPEGGWRFDACLQSRISAQLYYANNQDVGYL